MQTVNHKRSGCGQKVSKSFLRSDSFGESFKLKLDSKGSESLPSCSGSVLSILSLMLTTVYFVYQFMIFQSKSGQEMTLSVEENFFTEDDIFGPDDGFMMAAAAVERDFYTPIDPKFGKLVFYHVHWGYDGGEDFRIREKILTHKCSDEELGLVRSEYS